MQQWKLYNFADKLKTLLIKGKTLQDFKNINEKSLSSREFTDTLFYTLHPFEIKDYTKIISPIQKAITMAIYMHGGSASEDEIVDFLKRHWLEITNVSKQNFVRKPDSRLLHLNMAVKKKKGLKLFTRNPDNPTLIEVNNENTTEGNDYNSDDSAQEECKPVKSKENPKKLAPDLIDPMQNDSKFDFEVPSNLKFDDIVIFVVEETCSRALASNHFMEEDNYGVTIDQIIEKVENFKDNQGSFLHLPTITRVRAILLEAKNMKIVDSKFSGQKELWFSRKMAEALKKQKDDMPNNRNMFKISIPKPFASLKIKELTISQLYERFTQDKNFGLECMEFLP